MTGETTEQLLEQAEAAAAEGKRDRARQLVVDALTLDGRSVAAWALRARLAREPREARISWQRVRALARDHPEARAFLSPPQGHAPARPAAPEPIAPRPRWRETLVGLAAFIAQRLAFGALVLVAIVFLGYLGLGMAQGVAFYPALGRSASKTLEYLGRLIRGELGLSAAGSVTAAPVTVAEVVPDVLGKSLGLLAAALLIATLVGVTLGIWASAHRRSGWSLVTILASVVGVSVPSFFAALLLQLAAIRLTRTLGHPLLPVGGFGTNTLSCQRWF